MRQKDQVKSSKLKVEKRQLKLAITIFIFGFVFCLPAAGFEGLNRPVGGRAIALGEAFVGEASDMGAIYWNPSGLTQVKGQNIIFMEQDVFGLGITYDYIGYSRNDKGEDAYGLSLARLDYSKSDLGYDWKEDAYTFFYATQIDPQLSFALSLKYLQMSTVSSRNGQGWGGDASLLYKVDEKLKVGFLARDVYTQVHYNSGMNETIQKHFTLGFSYRPDPVTLALLDFTDLDSPENSPWAAHLGVERWLDKEIAVRLGYISSQGTKGGKFTAGVGLILGPWRIDYAYAPTKSNNKGLMGIEDSQKISVIMRVKR